MPFAVARTRDEAHLYLELHMCEDCGSPATGWEHGLADVEGELVASYTTVCPGCGTEREFLFGLPEREAGPGPFPNFGGPEPSEILDAGQWLQTADDAAGDVPVDDQAEAARQVAIARAAVEEVVKFIQPGQDAVPADGFWTEDGRRVRDTEPGRFRLERLLVVRDTYRDLGTETGVI